MHVLGVTVEKKQIMHILGAQVKKKKRTVHILGARVKFLLLSPALRWIVSLTSTGRKRVKLILPVLVRHKFTVNFYMRNSFPACRTSHDALGRALPIWLFDVTPQPHPAWIQTFCAFLCSANVWTKTSGLLSIFLRHVEGPKTEKVQDATMENLVQGICTFSHPPTCCQTFDGRFYRTLWQHQLCWWKGCSGIVQCPQCVPSVWKAHTGSVQVGAPTAEIHGVMDMHGWK